MLCQYLGFDESTGGIDDISHGKPSGQDVASGDLICYNTQSSGVSCCVNLETSVITQTIKTPYARCMLKTCNNPILQDNKMFSDFVFSGNGSSGSGSYKLARFYNTGWCPTQSGTKYLIIDLQKDYHIKQVIILGNKNQTKWSKLYSLKYSHTESLVDGRRARTVNGNMNGYEASYTTLNFYNARCMKIESTGNTEFCLRIELCGEAQQPASVHQLHVTPRAKEADVSWKLEGSKTSSYITHYNIYLNGRFRYRISRVQYAEKLSLSELKAFTEYTIGIQAQDSVLQSATIVSTKFTTNKGVPDGPPLNVCFTSQGKTSLKITWEPPEERKRNGNIVGYLVSIYINNASIPAHSITRELSHTIDSPLRVTIYSVEIAARTLAGYGVSSSKISFITNGDPVKPVVPISYSSLSFDILPINAQRIKNVMVVVQIATNNPKSSEDIKTNELKAHEPKTQDPYIAAYFQTTNLPSTFIVGDGKYYIYENKIYSNSPLEQNTRYIIFLRFFENQNLFYSTEWSSGVRTMVKPPAPVILNPRLIGSKLYNIIWSQPSLPSQQTILTYYIKYRIGEGSQMNLNVSKATTSHNISANLGELYMFAVQVETEAGKSDFASISTRAYSGPLNPPQKINGSYIITLRKPDVTYKIQKVALILLQLQSSSSRIPLPDGIVVQESQQTIENTVAFLAKEFDIAEFQEGPTQVSIQEKKQRRRKREVVQVFVELEKNTTYHAAQRNQDEFGNYFWTDWSPSFTVVKGVVDGNDGDLKECESKFGIVWYIIVVTSLSSFVFGIIFSYTVLRFVRKRNSQPKPEPQTGNDNRIYDDLNLAKINKEDKDQSLRRKSTSSYVAPIEATYTALSQERDVENTYQSLT